MQRLGMGDLADSVLARARRQVGNSAEGLLELMAQYRRQGDVDAAVQIALQVLRRSAGQATRLGVVDDAGRRLAIEALASSGKLPEMIERVEGQVALAPRSLALRQALAAYYQAAGEAEKLRANNEAIVDLRPDDVPLRMQVAAQLAASGDLTAALGHYRAAFKIDPSSFSTYSRPIITTLQRAGRFDDLLKLLDEAGLKTFEDLAGIRLVAQDLMKDPKTLDRGAALVFKAARAYPENLAALLAPVATVGPFWDRPGAYELAKGAILPRPEPAAVPPWSGLDATVPPGGWGDDGRLTTLAGRLLDVAGRSGRLDDLAGSIEASLARRPNWRAGQALLAAVRLRQGKVAEGRAILGPILADPSASPPFEALMTLGQEARDVPGAEALATALHERANQADRAINFSGFWMKPSSVRQLALLYRKAGRAADALAVATRAEEGMRAPISTANPALAAYRRISSLSGLGGLYLELGDPADALRDFDELVASGDDVELARTYPTREIYPAVDALLAPARGAFEAAKQTLADGALAPTLAALIRPGDPAGPVDLRLTIHPREVDRARVDSLLLACLELASRDPVGWPKVKSDLEGIARARPDDFEARVALALAACVGGDPGSIAAAATALDRASDEAPPVALPAGVRPDVRRREDAARRLGFWLVARACWAHDSTAEVGDRLAAKALPAAKAQLDARWTLAMLREQGLRSLDRGDRKGAEATWSSLLDRILEDDLAPAAPAADAPKARLRVPPASVARFRQAAELAGLAAEHGLAELSLRAVRDPLKGGPPVVPAALNSAPAGAAQRAATVAADAPPDPTALLVEAKLVELDALWARAQVPPEAAYETLRDVVLPPARPAEVFLFDPASARVAPGSAAGAKAGEVARLLARRAVAAGRADDLRRRLEARQPSPAAKAAARRLLAAIEEAERAP